MKTFLDILQGPESLRLASVLLHSLWQGAAVALVVAFCLRRVPAHQYDRRYTIALGGLFAVVLALFVTWSVLGVKWNLVGTAAPPATFVDDHAADATATAVSEASTAGHELTAEPSSPAPVPGRSGPPAPAWPTIGPVLRWALPTLLAAWGLGCLLMLFRLSRQLLAARAYMAAFPVLDPRLLEAVERIRTALRLRCHVRVLSLKQLDTPVVFGFWKPLLVVPLSFMTGLTPEQQFAIVAHELAHIYRWDFVANLVQLLIESILFFNPAVLWLSRQIRIEREACCDAIAIALTENPVDYARTLADWADRMYVPPALVPAFAEPAGSGSLVDRVRRILFPHQTPHLRVGWLSLAAMLVLIASALGLVACGTQWAVAQTARALSDAERVEALKEAREAMPMVDDADLRNDKPVRIVGTVKNEEGASIPHVHLSIHSQAGNSGHSLGSVGGADGTIKVMIPGGRIRTAIFATGYAPVIFPERREAGGGEIDLGEVVLRKGRPARIRFVDPQGKPVAADRVFAAPAVLNSYPSADKKADSNGEFVAENVIDVEYKVGARAAGFQPVYGWQGMLPSEGVTTIEMLPAKVTSGRIVDETGEPVPGVAIYCRAERSDSRRPGTIVSHSYSHGTPGQLWAVSEQDGSFRIDQMADDSRIEVLLMKEGVVRGLAEDVSAGQRELTWTLDPEITLRGRVEGDLNLISKDPRYRSVFYSVLRDTKNQKRDQVLTGNFRIEADGSFTIPNLVRGTLSFDSSGLKVDRPVTGSESDIVLTLKAPDNAGGQETRTVTVEFLYNGEPVHPAGQLVLESYNSNMPRTRVDLSKTPVTFEAPTLARVQINGSRMLGFMPAKSLRQSFEPEELGKTVSIAVVPAGMIAGTVRDADGKPIAGAKVGIQMPERAGIDLPESLETNETGEFVLNPLPLRGEAYVYAQVERARVWTEGLTLDMAHPDQRITLAVPRLREAVIELVDTDGKPVADIPLILEFDRKLGRSSVSSGYGVVATTGRDGIARIKGVSPDLGDYWLYPPKNGPWLGEQYRLTGKSPQRIVLKRGHVLTGRVLDESGSPVPGVTLGASCVGETRPENALYYFTADDKTDEEGRFRFSNLPAVPMSLTAHGVQEPPQLPPGRQFMPDGDEVTIQGKVADWLRNRDR